MQKAGSIKHSTPLLVRAIFWVTVGRWRTSVPYRSLAVAPSVLRLRFSPSILDVGAFLLDVFDALSCFVREDPFKK